MCAATPAEAREEMMAASWRDAKAAGKLRDASATTSYLIARLYDGTYYNDEVFELWASSGCDSNNSLSDWEWQWSHVGDYWNDRTSSWHAYSSCDLIGWDDAGGWTTSSRTGGPCANAATLGAMNNHISAIRAC